MLGADDETATLVGVNGNAKDNLNKNVEYLNNTLIVQVKSQNIYKEFP